MSGDKIDPTIVLLNSLLAEEGLLRNLAGRPCLELPMPAGALSLDSTAALRWLAFEAYQRTGVALSRTELRPVIDVLCGKAQTLPEENARGSELWDRIAGEMIVQAIFALMEGQESYEASPTQCLSDLAEAAGKIGLATSQHWPTIPALLSKALKNLRGVLEAAGFRVTNHRTNTSRFITITRLPANASRDGDDGDDSLLMQSSRPNSRFEDILLLGVGGDDPSTTRAKVALTQFENSSTPAAPGSDSTDPPGGSHAPRSLSRDISRNPELDS